MKGGTYAEAQFTFKNTDKAGFFAGLGCTIKNYVADIMTTSKYSEYAIGEFFNMNKFMEEAVDAGFSTSEIAFIQRFVSETIEEAIELGFSKIADCKKERTFKARIVAKIRNIADNLEKN